LYGSEEVLPSRKLFCYLSLQKEAAEANQLQKERGVKN